MVAPASSPTYLRNCWYVAAWDYELAAQPLLSRTILGEPIVMYSQADGALVAMEDRCAHRGVPLSMGQRDGDGVRCGYHGFRFSATGRCTDIPGKTRVATVVQVKTYPIALDGSWVWVWMGDPALADRALIPSSTSLKDPAWEARAGHVDYEAYYELVNDNLTELSHLSFLHVNSFGAGADWAQNAPEVQVLPRGVRVGRWVVSGSTAKKVGDAAQLDLETWVTYDYLAPGVMRMTNHLFPQGTSTDHGRQPPTPEMTPVARSLSWQAVTPVTDTSSRYYFAIATPAGEHAGFMADRVFAMSQMAFEEDRVMIEAQQRNLQRTGDRMLLVGHDESPVKMRAVMQQLAQAETRR